MIQSDAVDDKMEGLMFVVREKEASGSQACQDFKQRGALTGASLARGIDKLTVFSYYTYLAASAH